MLRKDGPNVSGASRHARLLHVGRVRRHAVCIHLALSLSGCGRAPDQATPSAVTTLPTVAVVAAEERLVALERTGVGTVKPVRTSTIGSPVQDRVVECMVEEGDFVRARQNKGASPLARLRTEAAEIELAAAEAELKAREYGVEELRLRAPKEIEKAKAAKDAAEALKDFAWSRLERTRDLHGKGVVGDQDLEEHRSAAETAEKTYLERETEWELASSGLWTEKIKQAEANVDTQRQTIARLKDSLARHIIYAPFDGFVTRKYVEIGQWVNTGDPIVEVVEIDQVYVEAPVPESYVSRLKTPAFLFHIALGFAEELKDRVFSPELRQAFARHGISFAGDHDSYGAQHAVAVSTIEKGREWAISGPAATSTNAGHDFSYRVIRRESLDVYRAGTVAQVEIDALPGRRFFGEVEAIVPRADLHSRCFPVRVRLKNPTSPLDTGNMLFKPGMLARVTLSVEKVARLVVPKDAVVLTGSSQVVWVIEREVDEAVLGPATVKRVPVEVDLETSDREWTAIQGPVDASGSLPLRGGEWVIVEGNERLTPALRVNTVKIWSMDD